MIALFVDVFWSIKALIVISSFDSHTSIDFFSCYKTFFFLNKRRSLNLDFSLKKSITKKGHMKCNFKQNYPPGPAQMNNFFLKLNGTLMS